jgi:hypothetical protein
MGLVGTWRAFMLITVVRKDAGPPTPEEPGEEIWKGGYIGPAEDGTDHLPASILAEMAQDIDVGKWYQLEHITDMLSDTDTSQGETWTEIEVPTLGLPGSDTVALQVRHKTAALELINAVVEFSEKVIPEGVCWIRVE